MIAEELPFGWHKTPGFFFALPACAGLPLLVEGAVFGPGCCMCVVVGCSASSLTGVVAWQPSLEKMRVVVVVIVTREAQDKRAMTLLSFA